MDSDSDCAFESADEEIEVSRGSSARNKFTKHNQVLNRQHSGIGSDSDDDNEFVPSNVNTASWSTEISNMQKSQDDKTSPLEIEQIDCKKNTEKCAIETSGLSVENDATTDVVDDSSVSRGKGQSGVTKRPKPERQRKPKEQKPAGLGAKKLGCKILPGASTPSGDVSTPAEIRQKALGEGKKPPIIQECWEFDDEEATKILQKESQRKKSKLNWGKSKDDTHDSDDFPEELKSNKSFKEVFKTDGWEAIESDVKIEKKNADVSRSKGVVEKAPTPTTLSTPATATPEDSSGGWGSWGSWGVNSILNTASIGVSTISSHVSHGLSLLEETIATPEPENPAPSAEHSEKKETIGEEKDSRSPGENQSQGGSFGFGNLMYGVSSITKLVESTGNKVISGGLGTLETIGKKTMEVLQEGDPGLKKKRAFFMNEGDKPILSQMLREAKDKAEVEEKSVEGRELAKKVVFEILFDDFQGLVHLEALEMLSKQSNMKIQQKLVTLDSDELDSIQETLDEVKELCDLGDEDDEEETEQENLKEKLKNSCSDLGVDINYNKINEIWEETESYIKDVSRSDSVATDSEIFQNAISTLARFTAFSVERFHKTAELLLIKERRSTVNEADALVQLTRILSGQISIAASLFSKCLNERSEQSNKSSESIDITTIFLEATNASSYIQDAFRLLMPILQVGAI